MKFAKAKFNSFPARYLPYRRYPGVHRYRNFDVHPSFDSSYSPTDFSHLGQVNALSPVLARSPVTLSADHQSTTDYEDADLEPGLPGHTLGSPFQIRATLTPSASKGPSRGALQKAIRCTHRAAQKLKRELEKLDFALCDETEVDGVKSSNNLRAVSPLDEVEDVLMASIDEVVDTTTSFIGSIAKAVGRRFARALALGPVLDLTSLNLPKSNVGIVGYTYMPGEWKESIPPCG
ncbi:hypothetical protein JVT61DRAFT_7687 [Boletus reticuloceps]|uniref:Uncharacterized protein n=1 Tax=Boletus reticuloceps TaxID=495285 RepID=A0A8I2YI48_9AGAM|nr:hypothetical protein JVT61DRAFT_7687 [Boletus reticuloceps]